jgi:hypothetical protein
VCVLLCPSPLALPFAKIQVAEFSSLPMESELTHHLHLRGIVFYSPSFAWGGGGGECYLLDCSPWWAHGFVLHCPASRWKLGKGKSYLGKKDGHPGVPNVLQTLLWNLALAYSYSWSSCLTSFSVPLHPPFFSY